jgi:hypothetical protein
VLSDGRYRWDAGAEGKPSERGNGPSRELGAIIDTSLVEASMVRTGTYAVWHRLETNDSNGTIIVETGHFPTAKDARGHDEANKELTHTFAGGVQRAGRTHHLRELTVTLPRLTLQGGNCLSQWNIRT